MNNSSTPGTQTLPASTEHIIRRLLKSPKFDRLQGFAEVGPVQRAQLLELVDEVVTTLVSRHVLQYRPMSSWVTLEIYGAHLAEAAATSMLGADQAPLCFTGNPPEQPCKFVRDQDHPNTVTCQVPGCNYHTDKPHTFHLFNNSRKVLVEDFSGNVKAATAAFENIPQPGATK